MNGRGRKEVLKSLVPLVNEVKQKAPDVFEISRMDFPVELSLTVGEIQRILLDCCHIDGFLAVLKEHKLNPIGRDRLEKRLAELTKTN
jgi:hypothetical protein